MNLVSIAYVIEVDLFARSKLFGWRKSRVYFRIAPFRHGVAISTSSRCACNLVRTLFCIVVGLFLFFVFGHLINIHEFVGPVSDTKGALRTTFVLYGEKSALMGSLLAIASTATASPTKAV